ncbi:cytochrome c oxidase subunit II [Halocola ammonii]
MLKLLIVLVVILGIIAIAQLAKVYELSAKMRNKREEEISHADNKLNAVLMIVFMLAFYAGVIYLMVEYGNYLPPAASEHGAAMDQLMTINLWIIIAVFFIVNTLLFYFSFKYYFRKDRKAKFFPHDNRLELVWTVIPSIVLAFLIIYGLRTWSDITGKASEGTLQVEIYAKQFDWTARYPGENGAFGAANFNVISTMNPLGLITDKTINEKIAELDKEIKTLEERLQSEEMLLLPEDQVEALEDRKYRLTRHKQRVYDLESYEIDGINAWEAGMDDKIMKGEFHLPVGREVEMIFRSRDVIHSAYLPHLRAQMNAVPGVPTRFKVTPTITTDSMRQITENPDFDYVLLCNKICGSAHFNMQIKLVVESEEDYQAWLAEQETFGASMGEQEASNEEQNEESEDPEMNEGEESENMEGAEMAASEESQNPEE